MTIARHVGRFAVFVALVAVSVAFSGALRSDPEPEQVPEQSADDPSGGAGGSDAPQNDALQNATTPMGPLSEPGVATVAELSALRHNPLIDNDDLATRVRIAVMNDDEVMSQRVAVATHQGVVALSGTVPNMMARHDLIDRVRILPGVVAVQADNLLVQ